MKSEPTVNIVHSDDINYQLAYRKAERDKADLMYENQMLRSKIVTLTWMIIGLLAIFVVAIFVNAIK